jgi:hypothetical protein
MDGERKPKRVNLCIYSRAAGGGYTDCHGAWNGRHYVHLDECPLGLKRTEAPRCPCKRYERATEIHTNADDYGHAHQDVRVSTCAFPLLYGGKEIADPEAFVAWLRRHGRLK